MFVPRSTCFQALCHVYAQIYMPMFSLPCFCLDLHANAQIYVFMLKLMCLYAPCQACMLRSILVAMPCATLALFSPLLISLFLAFWPFWWGVGLNPMVQSYILTPRPILKGLDHFFECQCLLTCFYTLSICQPLYIQALPCFVPSVGLCFCDYTCPSQGFLRCNHL